MKRDLYYKLMYNVAYDRVTEYATYGD